MAPAEHITPHEPATRQTLWLSIRLDGENWLFEIGPNEEKAIVVGSLLRAHVRIDRRDIAPVHFLFEREQDRVRLCPAYGADISVNGVRVSGPHELEAHATITFAGIELEAYVCDVEPHILEQLDLRDWTADELPDCGTVLSLPEGAEPTRAIQRLSVAIEVPADATKAHQPLCDVHLRAANEALTHAETEAATPDLPATVDEHCEPTWPGVRPAPRSARTDSQSASGLDSTIDEFPSTAPVCADNAQTAPRAVPPRSLLARIGIAALHRPLLVALGALCGSTLLALAMLATAGRRHPTEVTLPARALVVSTSLAAPPEPSPPSFADETHPVSSAEPEVTVVALAPPSATPRLVSPHVRPKSRAGALLPHRP